MADMMSMQLRGADELDRKLKKLSQDVGGPMLKDALKAGGAVLQKAAKSRVPVRSGQLRDNIKVGTVKKSGQGFEVPVGIGSDEFYGRFLEFGTKKMSAKPWLRPALDESKDDIERAVADELRRQLGMIT